MVVVVIQFRNMCFVRQTYRIQIESMEDPMAKNNTRLIEIVIQYRPCLSEILDVMPYRLEWGNIT